MATGFAAIKGEDPALCILGHYLFHCFITEKGFIACLTKAIVFFGLFFHFIAE